MRNQKSANDLITISSQIFIDRLTKTEKKSSADYALEPPIYPQRGLNDGFLPARCNVSCETTYGPRCDEVRESIEKEGKNDVYESKHVLRIGLLLYDLLGLVDFTTLLDRSSSLVKF